VSDDAAGIDHPGSGGPLRAVVVDDQEVFGPGTRQVLETTQDIVVVGEADSWDAALGLIDQHRPDVALVDIQLAGRDGIDLARQLSADHPATRVVILSAYDDDAFIRRAFEAGVAGYLLKTMPRDDLINAVRAVGLGTIVLDPAVSTRLAGAHESTEIPGVPRLTLREQQVVTLVAEGLSNKAIANRLGVSTRTVEGHVNHVFTKLAMESRTELVRYVLTNGLPTPPPTTRPER